MHKAAYEKIAEIRDKIKSVESHDISYTDLGTASGFHEAEETKKRLIEYIDNKLDFTEKYIDSLNNITLLDNLTHIDNITNNITNLITQINNLVEQGVHNQNYPNQRQNFIKSFNDQEVALKKALYNYETELKICELSSAVTNKDQIKKSFSEIEQLKKDIEKTATESRKILDNLQNKAAVTAIEESASGFSALRDNYGRYETRWFWAFIITSTLVVWGFYNAIFTDIDLTNTSKAIFDFVKKLLLISIPAIFLKIAIGKYNLERNLRIIYSHRESVLNQYKNFENAIGDDTEAKNSFRLEIAKYIFSDPQTGYLGRDSKSGEVNINPIVNLAEKIAKTNKTT